MDARFLIVILLLSPRFCWSQKAPVYSDHMTPYAFRYSANPRSNNLAAHLNRERIKKSNIKTCTVITSRTKGKKVMYPPVITSVYHYNTTGFPIMWEFYGFENSDPSPPDQRDQNRFLADLFPYQKTRDSLENIARTKFKTPPTTLNWMRWVGWGQSVPNTKWFPCELVKTYFDSTTQLIAKEYTSKGSLAARIIFKEDTHGDIREIQAFANTGLRLYYKKRLTLANGNESQSIGETEKGTYIRSFKYDSLGYRFWEGSRYYPKDSTKKELRKARKYESYIEYTYDDDYYPLTMKQMVRGKCIAQKTYTYDENKNLLKLIFDMSHGETLIKEYSYYP